MQQSSRETLFNKFTRFLAREGVLHEGSSLFQDKSLFSVARDPVEDGVLQFYEDVAAGLIRRLSEADLKKLASYLVRTYMATRKFNQDFADVHSTTTEPTLLINHRSSTPLFDKPSCSAFLDLDGKVSAITGSAGRCSS